MVISLVPGYLRLKIEFRAQLRVFHKNEAILSRYEATGLTAASQERSVFVMLFPRSAVAKFEDAI